MDESGYHWQAPVTKKSKAKRYELPLGSERKRSFCSGGEEFPSAERICLRQSLAEITLDERELGLSDSLFLLGEEHGIGVLLVDAVQELDLIASDADT